MGGNTKPFTTRGPLQAVYVIRRIYCGHIEEIECRDLGFRTESRLFANQLPGAMYSVTTRAAIKKPSLVTSDEFVG